ncbi:MAG TPA: lantibiotic dehydratase C-terminal domain-containing protein, partial [Longimicrobiaceae bacterium]|jgi:hypothetical protein|nr:lantibiotic dehydratase C-terminal domain-containing protein [Longimicrobiaceae bacterium]
MRHLAVNVYHWGETEQNRLMTQCVGPTLRPLWEAGKLDRFWFHRYDARGPHVLLLLSVPEAGEDEVLGLLSAALDEYLAESPSAAVIDDAELEKRHRMCRGGVLCSLDEGSDIAPNNSFGIVERAPNGYPFQYVSGAPDEDAELWRTMGELSFWSIRHLGPGREDRAVVRWAAAQDRALVEAGLDAEPFWRFYACTLLHVLVTRLETEEAVVLAALPGWVGEKNTGVFDRLWGLEESDPVVTDAAREMARRAAAVPDGDLPARWWPVREITHCTFAQLNHFVRKRLPIVLYAWSRSAGVPAAEAEPEPEAEAALVPA